MAGDIFFTDSKVWSSNKLGLILMMRRATKNCHKDEAELVSMLSEAEEVRCLGINLCESHDMQLRLTELMLDAARERLEELLADPLAHPDEVRSVTELTDLAQAHLSSLQQQRG